MSEGEHFDRIEKMLLQLIDMIGSMLQETREMNKVQSIKSEELSIMNETQGTKKEDTRFIEEDLVAVRDEEEIMPQECEVLKKEEVMDLVKKLEMEQEIIWQKASENDKEIRRIKQAYNL